MQNTLNRRLWSVGLVSSLLLVAGCQSTPPQASTQFTPPQTAKSNAPVTLTNADRAQVETGVRAALTGGGNATLRTMIATRGGDGVVTLCGYVNSGAGDKPYIGTLSAAGFAVSAIAASNDEIIAVHASCGHKGIHI